MKTYQYQVLRYLHDHVTGEFVNAGLVFYEPQSGFLRAQVVTKAQRLTSFFPGLPAKIILADLRFFAKTINHLPNEWRTNPLFNQTDDLSVITAALIQPNDAAWQLTPVKRGLTLNPEGTCSDLYHRLIGEYQEEAAPARTGDEKVWRQSYKRYFDRYHVTDKLKPSHIPTSNDEIVFSHTWQNGVLNCLEPVTFQLKNAARAKDKAYKWVGRITELKTGSVPLHLYLLTASPADPQLRESIEQIIKAASSAEVQVDFVHESEADAFAQLMHRKMETADHD